MRRLATGKGAGASREAAQQGVKLLLEPINTRGIPGFF